MVGLTLAKGEPLATVVVKAATVKMLLAEIRVAAAAKIPADIAAPSSVETPVASMEKLLDSMELCCRVLGWVFHVQQSRALFSGDLHASSASGLQQLPLIADCHRAQNLIDT